jgi:membrane protein YqaA with SNARE-associated domain
VTIHPIVVLHKINAVLMATLKPLGIWGLGGLAFIDSGLFPLPTTMDGVVIGYVAVDHRKFLIYVLMAAGASAIGSLIPYYVGRAGGELLLLKRINRARYEGLRDRFERQEFMAIMVPAMMPPPMPIKLFEFAAGVFEMKPLPFATAIFCGKFMLAGRRSTSILGSRWGLWVRLCWGCLSISCASCSPDGRARSFHWKRRASRMRQRQSRTTRR